MEETLAKKRPSLTTWETLGGNVMKSGENYYLLPLFYKTYIIGYLFLSSFPTFNFLGFLLHFLLSHNQYPILNGFSCHKMAVQSFR